MTNPVIDLVAGEEERAIRESVRTICEPFGSGYIRALHDAGKPASELWQQLSAAGFAGTCIPEEWGGSGLGMTCMNYVVEEAAACGQFPLMLVLSSAMGGTLLSRHGSDSQKERWLRGIAKGSTQLAFAITEPGAGTNAHRMTTALAADGDHFLLTGQKVFTSGVEVAAAVIVATRFRRADGTLGKPTLCIVDVDAPGFSRTPIDTPPMAPEQHWQLFFDDVRIEPDRILGGIEGGLPVVFDGLNPERILVAALCNGFAMHALEKACAYARERVVWDQPIGAHQGIAHPLARGKIQVELARLMTRKAATLFDAGHPDAGEASNMAKWAAAEAAIHCVDRAVQTLGGNGLTYEFGMVDLWWRARGLKIGPVSEEMILNHIAQHSLGLPRSY